MAPFSKCSVCQVRTRKVVRDRVTRKNVYVCPACFKGKEGRKKPRKVQEKDEEPCVSAQREEIDVQAKVVLNSSMTLQNVPNESSEVQKENVEPEENDPDYRQNELQQEEETPAELPQEEVVQVEVQEQVESVQQVEEMPLIDRTNVNNNFRKITPPIMQIVVSNNRKYIAVSETADYDSPNVALDSD